MHDIAATDPPAQRAATAGCPALSLNMARERPVGEWMHDLEAIRDAAPIYWNEHGSYWIVTRGALVREIMQNSTIFTNDSISAANPDPPYRWIPSNINPPLHVQYRQILNLAFSPASVARIEPKTRAYCRAAIDRVLDQGHCDVMADVAGVFPTQVFLEITDLPASDAPMFVGWAERIFDGLAGVGGGTLADALVAMDGVKGYFAALIVERRSTANPPDDFFAHILRSTVDGRPLPDDDILNIYNQLVIAGLDTVKTSLGYAMLHLATHPEDRRWIVRDPSIIPNAVEEMLRGYSFISQARKVGADVAFHGCQLRQGDMVMLLIPAASRDDHAVERGSEILFDRPTITQLAFGAGPHRCLGSHLARMELQVGLEEWHRSIPEYELAVDVSEILERGGTQLAPRTLPVRWTR